MQAGPNVCNGSLPDDPLLRSHSPGTSDCAPKADRNRRRGPNVFSWQNKRTFAGLLSIGPFQRPSCRWTNVQDVRYAEAKPHPYLSGFSSKQTTAPENGKRGGDRQSLIARVERVLEMADKEVGTCLIDADQMVKYQIEIMRFIGHHMLDQFDIGPPRSQRLSKHHRLAEIDVPVVITGGQVNG